MIFMAKLDDKQLYIYAEDEIHDTPSYYDMKIYTETTSFLEEILDYEYLIDESDSKEEKLKVIKKYLKEIHHYKRKLMQKIERLKAVREDLKGILKE